MSTVIIIIIIIYNHLSYLYSLKELYNEIVSECGDYSNIV